MSTSSRTALAALAALAASCQDVERHTALQPQGPPEILQVLVQERAGDGGAADALAPRLAFGDHADVDDADDRAVQDAVAGQGQRIRVVFDELLRGNFLEEIACADGTWAAVPVGTRPEDVARCAGPDLSACTRVCPGIGILDADGDGGIDDTRLIDGAVELRCDDLDLAVDLDQSFYQPSGNQLVPAGPLGVEGLGPAVVLVPAVDLPTGGTCGLAFGEAVVDKHDERPCAAQRGACAPGDTTAIAFGVEPLRLLASDPADGSAGVSPAADAEIALRLNVALEPGSLGPAAVAVVADGAPIAGVTAALDAADPRRIVVSIPGGLAPGTAYHLTLTAGDGGVTDRYGGALPAAVDVQWTTAD